MIFRYELEEGRSELRNKLSMYAPSLAVFYGLTTFQMYKATSIKYNYGLQPGVAGQSVPEWVLPSVQGADENACLSEEKMAVYHALKQYYNHLTCGSKMADKPMSTFSFPNREECESDRHAAVLPSPNSTPPKLRIPSPTVDVSPESAELRIDTSSDSISSEDEDDLEMPVLTAEVPVGSTSRPTSKMPEGSPARTTVPTSEVPLGSTSHPDLTAGAPLGSISKPARSTPPNITPKMSADERYQ